MSKEERGFDGLTEDEELSGVSQDDIKRFRELEKRVCKILRDSKGDLKQELTKEEQTSFHKLSGEMADILDKRDAADAAQRCMSR